MFEAIKAAFSVTTGGWVKYVLGIVAVGAILFGVYEYGSSHGYKDGYQKAWDAQQKTIQKMVETQNAATTEQNKKITQLEQDAADADRKIKAYQQAQDIKRNDVVQNYKAANPKVASAPAWSPETVNAINQMLGVQK